MCSFFIGFSPDFNLLNVQEIMSNFIKQLAKKISKILDMQYYTKNGLYRNTQKAQNIPLMISEKSGCSCILNKKNIQSYSSLKSDSKLWI